MPYAIRYLFAYHAKALHLALKVIIRAIGRYYIQKSGIKKSQVGSVTLIQRFGSSAGNLNVHFHILFVDGVFDKDANYHGVSAPTNDEVAQLVHKIKVRVLRSLEKKGYIQGYDVNLEEDKLYQEHGALTEILMGSIQNKNLLGKKVETLGKFGPGQWAELKGNRCATKDGFNLHANTCISAYDRKARENLCRYICRPPISNERMKMSGDGHVIYELKKPWSDGSTHIKLTPEDLIIRLIALVPPPRINLIRFHGVFGPRSKIRKKVVPLNPEEVETNVKSYRIEWARLLKRVFQIEITKCQICGGELKIIAAITNSAVISVILEHLKLPALAPLVASARAPPQQNFIDW